MGRCGVNMRRDCLGRAKRMRALWHKNGIRVLVYAFVLYGILFAVSGLITGGDSNFYLKLAERISQGDFGFISEWPLHWLYSGFLSIGYSVMPSHIMAFTTAFNLIVLAVLPYFFYRISLMLTGLPKLSYWAGIAVMFQVYFIFWALYILTDSLFLTVLTGFILVVLWYAKRGGIKPLIVLIAVSCLLLFSRPSSVVALPIGWGYAVYVRWGKMVLVRLSAVALVVLVGILSIPPTRDMVLGFPTIYQSLWLGARTSTNNIDEITEGFKFDLPDGVSEKNYKLGVFANFVKEQPVKYIAMCGQRLVSYWHPWIWAKWELPHKTLEFVYSFFMTAIIGVAVFWRKVGKEKWLLLSLAGGFSLLTVFGQIDSDVRYRLPAELCVLLLAVMVAKNINWGSICLKLKLRTSQLG